MDVIILAGGLGKRLQEVVFDVPKPLAPICGTPFLDLLLHSLKNVSRVILAIGYRAEKIKKRYEKHSFPFPILFSEEKTPLGTGGGLKLALTQANSEDVLVLNGDTYVEIPWDPFFNYHQSKKGEATLLCLPKQKENRFGNIVLDSEGKIVRFSEKENEGNWINGGVYLIKKGALDPFAANIPLSLEKEIFPPLLKKGVFGYPHSSFFIDIGTKESYLKAQEKLACLCKY